MDTGNLDAVADPSSIPSRSDVGLRPSDLPMTSLTPLSDGGNPPSSGSQSDDGSLDVMSILMFKATGLSVPMSASSNSASAPAVTSSELPESPGPAPVSSSSPSGGRGRCRSMESNEEKPKDLCRVCSDVATGFHYGVVSCEGCKGFFKRSVQMNRKYRCRLMSQCSVNRKTRNSCQSCRFSRCLAVGMSVTLVRPDRTPGNRRKRPLTKKELANLASRGSEQASSSAGPTSSTDFPVHCPPTGTTNHRTQVYAAAMIGQNRPCNGYSDPSDVEQQLSATVDQIRLIGATAGNGGSIPSISCSQNGESPESDTLNCVSSTSSSGAGMPDSPNSNCTGGIGPQHQVGGASIATGSSVVVGLSSGIDSKVEERPTDMWTEPQMTEIIDNMSTRPMANSQGVQNDPGEMKPANLDRCHQPGLTLGAPPVLQANTPVPDKLVLSQLSVEARQVVQAVQAGQPNVVPDYSTRLPSILTSQCFMNVAYDELESIVTYAKMQYGFRDLFMNDRRQLLRNSFLAIQIVRLSYRSLDCDGKILFARGLCLSPTEANQISKFPSIVINMNLELIEWFRSLQVNEIESGLLQSIVLSSDDADGLMDRAAVRRMQNRHLEALREYSICRFPHEPHRFASLLLRLPFVRKMALVCLENFFLMIESGQLAMNQLTQELIAPSDGPPR